MPAIIRFLGYNPSPPPNSFRERLVWARKALGLSQKVMAEMLGIDPTMIRQWENGTRRPSNRLLDVVEPFLKARALPLTVKLRRRSVQFQAKNPVFPLDEYPSPSIVNLTFLYYRYRPRDT